MIHTPDCFSKTILVATLLTIGCTGSGMAGCGSESSTDPNGAGPAPIDSELVGAPTRELVPKTLPVVVEMRFRRPFRDVGGVGLVGSTITVATVGGDCIQLSRLEALGCAVARFAL